MSTIFALSSGQPPAGIAVIRISGEAARDTLALLCGELPSPRRASLRRLVDRDDRMLDQALVLWFPGPHTATGEDLAELHLHGGRAVVSAVKAALVALPQLREAEPGEFTRRAFANGRIDLAEAEGLADLLSAETELQRQSAMTMAGGELSRQVIAWRDEVLHLGALVEAVLDFGDEDDVAELPVSFGGQLAGLTTTLGQWLSRPRAEALREGLRVVLAGPPNAGKSTLFNALVESEAAITAPSAGTTRDAIVRPVSLGGAPFSFVDTAGLREDSGDPVEAIGIDRARGELDRADLVLWLGEESAGPEGCWDIEAQIDRPDSVMKVYPRHRVSAVTGEGMDHLRRDLIQFAGEVLPKPGDVALNLRQHHWLEQARAAIEGAGLETNPLLIAEQLRFARQAFDRLIGRAGTEDMLDMLFGRFCIGK